MCKEIELRKHTEQERQEALDWLKAQVYDRIPFAKGFVRFTQEQVDEITADVHDNVNCDRLLKFLLMCWYNWVDDGGDSDGRPYTSTSGRGDSEHKRLLYCLPFDATEEDIEDKYILSDVINILFYGQNCWPFRSKEGDKYLFKEPIYFFEDCILRHFWHNAIPEQKEVIFKLGTVEFPPRPKCWHDDMSNYCTEPPEDQY